MKHLLCVYNEGPVLSYFQASKQARKKEKKNPAIYFYKNFRNCGRGNPSQDWTQAQKTKQWIVEEGKEENRVTTVLSGDQSKFLQFWYNKVKLILIVVSYY
jgi:hypothetical protein